MLGGKKWGGLQAKEHHPHREARGVAASCCGGALLQEGLVHKIDGIMRQENDVGILQQHLKTSVRKLKLGHKWVGVAITKPEKLKKCVQARRPTNLTQLHQLCQEEWAKIHPTYCGKLVEGYLKRLT